ncbi:Adenylosuccinate synthetase [Candidatus Promineifilum breve]|uniref:Adenylosuccinate synthetase n=1 Tax=Candidatus Promineifilum breve TaxID=1806508 RepID=A0A161KAY4_9CHLR|nr:adenylosuccinate synthase [Candidatus Promineifilum breve]CUS04633.2 Adenylosuccinate synthetase [Candidatus Promineifilum breve]
MPLNIIIGAQWGDEGKGHITDRLAHDAAVVARYSGGDNAGHTVTIAGEIFKLHLIPSGIIHPGVLCLIGNGTVVNPAVLLREMDALAARGVDVSPERLKLSGGAHLITPAHIALDQAHERARGKEAIGTTMRGIGPTYTDKARREGLRAELFADHDALAEALMAHVAAKNEALVGGYGEAALDGAAVAAEFAAHARRLAPHLVDGPLLVDEALRRGAMVLAEGAQGTLLDIDHGTYPFVTSSSPTAGGALTGLGVGPREVDRVIGVAKAFTTRVGSGPFPTELDGAAATRLRGTGEKPWDEFGTTTGRPRRVGWLDLPILRHARRVNSLSELVLTKLDILSGLDEIPVCVVYELDGRRVESFPHDLRALARCRPIYEMLPGWAEDVTETRRPGDLPDAARRYVDFVAAGAGAPVSYVSVGPGREQFIVM